MPLDLRSPGVSRRVHTSHGREGCARIVHVNRVGVGMSGEEEGGIGWRVY